MEWIDILALIIDMTPDGPQKHALTSVRDTAQAEVVRLSTVARKARLLALGTQNNTSYAVDMRWVADIIALTHEFPDEEPWRTQ